MFVGICCQLSPSGGRARLMLRAWEGSSPGCDDGMGHPINAAGTQREDRWVRAREEVEGSGKAQWPELGGDRMVGQGLCESGSHIVGAMDVRPNSRGKSVPGSSGFQPHPHPTWCQGRRAMQASPAWTGPSTQPTQISWPRKCLLTMGVGDGQRRWRRGSLVTQAQGWTRHRQHQAPAGMKLVTRAEPDYLKNYLRIYRVLFTPAFPQTQSSIS